MPPASTRKYKLGRAATSTAPIAYLEGFGNEFTTEALPGALPLTQNSPQQCAYGLYAEQVSGTAFTLPRHANRRSWLYRIRPSAHHPPFKRIADGCITNDFAAEPTSPNQLRWDPLPLPTKPTDFLDGLVTMAGNGSPADQTGAAVYMYAANRSMTDRFFANSDGELLIVPQQGRLRIATEMGRLDIEPQEIAVIPRSVRFKVELPAGKARGYMCENFGAPFRLPDLGVIGSNGLAHARHFQSPVAWYEDRNGRVQLINKFLGKLWATELDHSPLDVVAWHGNLAPYKYDLRRFNTIGSISFDHPDPSIFLVLQSASDTPGIDMIDFAIFPPRWLVMEHTFRPPWFHRNIASEFMGLVAGTYDAKAAGFIPGSASLHNCMAGHGPDAATFERASTKDISEPDRPAETMAFMFETKLVLRPTKFALAAKELQTDYYKSWTNIPKRFDPGKP
ncbi:MAG: homogentisate 1,2-dioxygenase [Burkholderiales bacterium]